MDLGKLISGLDLDDVRSAMQLVTQNKELLGKLTELPELLATMGQRLADAGEQARSAALALAGDDGKGGAAAALTNIGNTLDGCRDQLGKATGLLGTAAGAAKSVPLLGSAAGPLADGVAQVNGVVEQLGQLGGNMRDLAGILGTVGSAVAGLGDRLGDSGGTMRRFTG